MATAHFGSKLFSPTPKNNYGERRTARRFELSLPLAIFPLADRDTTRLWNDMPAGDIRDISTSGVYFTTDEKFAPGAAVAFALIFPNELTHGREILVCAQGEVVRTEKKTEGGLERRGVAARIQKYEILKDDPRYRESSGRSTVVPWPTPPASQ